MLDGLSKTLNGGKLLMKQGIISKVVQDLICLVPKAFAKYGVDPGNHQDIKQRGKHTTLPNTSADIDLQGSICSRGIGLL